jgi:hypothetical protein
VKEDGCDGGWNGNMTPAGTVVECRRKNCERGHAIENDGDFEPEERHR